MWAYPCDYTLFEFEQESIWFKILAFVLWLGLSKIISMTYVEGISYIYMIIYDLIDCVRLANSNRYGQGKYTEKEVISDLISQWSGSVSPFSYDELINWWTAGISPIFLWTGGKVRAQREEDCTTRERRGQPVPKIQHGFFKCSCSCTLTLIQIKKGFHSWR